MWFVVTPLLPYSYPFSLEYLSAASCGSVRWWMIVSPTRMAKEAAQLSRFPKRGTHLRKYSRNLTPVVMEGHGEKLLGFDGTGLLLRWWFPSIPCSTSTLLKGGFFNLVLFETLLPAPIRNPTQSKPYHDSTSGIHWASWEITTLLYGDFCFFLLPQHWSNSHNQSEIPSCNQDDPSNHFGSMCVHDRAIRRASASPISLNN